MIEYVNTGYLQYIQSFVGVRKVKEIFSSLIDNFIFTSDLVRDSNTFLLKHNRVRIAEHSLRVARWPKH